jgi:predicted metal-binding membrane protein
MTSTRTAWTVTALSETLGLAAASWVVAVRQMDGMDMGVATELRSFAFFVVLWVSMMAAMMLPGAVPAVLRRAHSSGRVRVVPLFVAWGVRSVTWMSVIAVLALAQKLLPPGAAIDVPLALALVGLGILIVIAPSSVPGLMPPM